MANDSSDRHWSGWKGDHVHPQSPLGGGGPGRFRTADPLCGASDPSGSYPHHASPVGRYHVPGFEAAQRLAQRRRPAAGAAAPAAQQPPTPAAQQPPPPTNPRLIPLPRQNTATRHVTVDVQILPDGSGSPARPHQGVTRFNREGLTVDFPMYTLDGAGHVNRVSTPLVIQGTITIQSYYGPGTRLSSPAQYGRGTTSEDVQAGNTTVGFHENCHREDLLRYLTSHPFPAFRGRVGMTERAFLDAQTQFNEAMDSYFLDMDAHSHTVTDEVGYTQSRFDQDGAQMQATQPTPAQGRDR